MKLKTSNMNYKIKQSKEIVWCDQDDRYIMVIKEDNEIIGLNYMQGDEFEFFTKHFDDIDRDLTDFYNSVKYYLGGETELDRVNQAIWAHFDYKNRKHERKYGFMRPQR
jgi:hypothetical protein